MEFENEFSYYAGWNTLKSRGDFPPEMIVKKDKYAQKNERNAQKDIALKHIIQSMFDYSSTAACAAANGSWLSALYGKFGKHLGNIMSMYCTFCTRFPQNIRPFLPLRLLFDILIVKHYC